MTLERRKPLARGSKVLRRGRAPKAKRLGDPEITRRAEVRHAVFTRDRGTCRLALTPGAGRCFGRLTVHHVIKASQGGPYEVDNLVALCAHHNDQIEADADLAALARSLGLVSRREDRQP